MRNPGQCENSYTWLPGWQLPQCLQAHGRHLHLLWEKLKGSDQGQPWAEGLEWLAGDLGGLTCRLASLEAQPFALAG